MVGYGIVLGLTLGTRIGGVLAVFFFGVVVLGWLWSEARAGGAPGRRGRCSP